MRWRGTRSWIAGSLLVTSVAAWSGPLRAQAATADSLSVYLFTAGQGDEVWERFGHNAIGVRGGLVNGDLLFNWGLFDFASPGFIGRFIKGDMVYWMGASDAFGDLQVYQSHNRDVVIQELNLTKSQRDSLLEFLNWNSQPENKYYHYNPFSDNCSTRLRDALDRVLGGALRRATDSVLTPLTYRDHALRLMAGMPLLGTGIDIGLGRPTDRPITAWEEMFIPMRLRDRIRDVKVPNDSGQLVPLVRAERVVYRAQRPPEATVTPHHNLLFLVLGLILGSAMLALAGVSRSRGATLGARVLVTTWSLGAGVLGCLLAFLWLGTRHIYAYENMNLLQFNPLWMIVGALVPFVRRPSAARAGVAVAWVAAALTVLALVLAFIPSVRQGSLDVLLLAVPPNIAAAIAMRRLSASENSRGVVR